MHYGRVNPRAAGFEFGAFRSDLDVAATAAALASAPNVADAVAATDPHFYHYGLSQIGSGAVSRIAGGSELNEVAGLRQADNSPQGILRRRPGIADTCLNDVNNLLRDFRAKESHRIDPTLLDVLYDLQVLANHDAHYDVISGYRSPQTNAMLHQRSSGVAEHSQHILGKAIDVRLSGFSTRTLSGYARSLSRGGVGFYASSDFVHIGTGRIRYW